MEDFSGALLFFWIPYVVIVNFAIMRVVAALIIKQTLDLAEIDAERIAMAKLKQRERYAVELRAIFEAGDTSGDKAISRDEFHVMLKNKSVVRHFEKLDLEIEEVDALFCVCCADDGLADYTELLDGALKMKNSARTIDAVQIMQKQLTMDKRLAEMDKNLGHIKELLQIGARLA